MKSNEWADQRDDGPDEARSSQSGEPYQHRLARLFREHNQALLRFLTARLHSEHEAREIAQEAYVRLLKLDEPDTVSYLRAFLFRTAANLAADRLKQRQRRRTLREMLFFEEVDKRSPESDYVNREELDRIKAAIEELPPKCRMAFILIKFDEMSFENAAERMGLSTRMVRIYVKRALAYCAARLEADGEQR